MSLSRSFQRLSFERKVREALATVERTLALERKPSLAADVDHEYGAKYALVDATTNAAIAAYATCLGKLGLDEAALRGLDGTKPATLRFEASISREFLKEVVVDVPSNASHELKEEVVAEEGGEDSKKTTTTKVMKVVKHVTEYHWEVTVDWSLSVYSGTAVGDKAIVKSRTCKTAIITRSKGALEFAACPPAELSLSWLLRQIDTDDFASNFKVDTEDEKTKTPRRNEAVDGALDFADRLQRWCREVRGFVHARLKSILQRHNPAVSVPGGDGPTMEKLLTVGREHPIFNPVLPLMDDSVAPPAGDEVGGSLERKGILGLKLSAGGRDGHTVLLSPGDTSKLLIEHARTIDEAIEGLEQAWPPGDSDGVLSVAEATLMLLGCDHAAELAAQYADAMEYVESMMEGSLIAAIGKRLTPDDLDAFVEYHNDRLLAPKPQPFSHAIRRPNHYPVGLLTIESKSEDRSFPSRSKAPSRENECVHTHSREVMAESSLKIPLSAATVLELTGRQYLHGYMNHRFGAAHKSHRLVARARQFSAFILVVGTMTDGSTLDPKDAIIVQNKDELIVPLLLEELPTAQEFKDAIKALSPEQQRFARAYRKMQLASSVFGVCVVQIKPQLEALLGLPADALDKEMELTQDLMRLFVDYQVPSDLLSYDGVAEGVATRDKISSVRDNVKRVTGVIDAEKDKQLASERAKTAMAVEQVVGSAARGATFATVNASPFGSSSFVPESAVFGSSAAPSPFGGPAPAPPAAMCAGFGAPSLDSLVERSDDLSRQSKMVYKQAKKMTKSGAGPGARGRDEVASAGTSEIAPRQSASTHTTEKVSGMTESKLQSRKGVDFTLMPQAIDEAVEKHGAGNALRATTIKTGPTWVRNRQENLLASPKKSSLTADDISEEKNKAFDLLDALSRSGSFSIAHSELHVVIAVTHCFEKDVMSTVICDNVNPIDKLEHSTLLLASTVHGVPARELIGDVSELQRLEEALPLLLTSGESETD